MSDGCVVDTDVISYLFRNNNRADVYRPYVTGVLTSISFMTPAELNLWSLQHNWGRAQQERMARYTEQFTIVLPDLELCQAWASVRDDARRQGRPIQVADAWVAATAISLNVPLVTNNRRDYLGVNDLLLLPSGADD